MSPSHDVLPLAIPAVLAAVVPWAAEARPGVAWRVVVDSDGAVGLVATGPGAESVPALLLCEDHAGEVEVTVCDPAAPFELGTFGTAEGALAGIARWLGAGASAVSA